MVRNCNTRARPKLGKNWCSKRTTRARSGSTVVCGRRTRRPWRRHDAQDPWAPCGAAGVPVRPREGGGGGCVLGGGPSGVWGQNNHCQARAGGSVGPPRDAGTVGAGTRHATGWCSCPHGCRVAPPLLPRLSRDTHSRNADHLRERATFGLHHTRRPCRGVPVVRRSGCVRAGGSRQNQKSTRSNHAQVKHHKYLRRGLIIKP